MWSLIVIWYCGIRNRVECVSTLEWAVIVLVFLLFPYLPLISSGSREATKSLTRSCEEQDDMSEWGVDVIQQRDWYVSKHFTTQVHPVGKLHELEV